MEKTTEPIVHKTDSTHPEWNESYYFVFFDKKNNIGGMSRLGFKPNKPEGMTFFFLFLPDGSVGGYFFTNKAKEYAKSLKVGGMVHQCQSDGNWKFNFRGSLIVVANSEDLPKVREQPQLIKETAKANLDLTFRPITEVYEYSTYMDPQSLEIGKKAGDKHWEQIASISGELKIGSNTYTIKNALGQRDHTYGVRDWTGVGNWLYYVVWFNEELAINPAAIVTEDGRYSTGGFIFQKGENIPLKTIKIVDQQFRSDGVFPVSSELELVDVKGNKHELKAKVGPIIPVPFKDEKGNQSILIQSFGTFNLDGNPNGYGTFETLRKVR